MWELTFAKRLYEHFRRRRDRVAGARAARVVPDRPVLARGGRHGVLRGHAPHGSTHQPAASYQTQVTECINEMVLESQLPHKIVNLFFTITD